MAFIPFSLSKLIVLERFHGTHHGLFHRNPFDAGGPELSILYRRVQQRLDEMEISVHKAWLGQYATTQEM
ncbi:MAG: hypothetical protein AAF485_02530, partial [Chloroflexota bacterium]